jgi:hypothetical protein
MPFSDSIMPVSKPSRQAAGSGKLHLISSGSCRPQGNGNGLPLQCSGSRSCFSLWVQGEVCKLPGFRQGYHDPQDREPHRNIPRRQRSPPGVRLRDRGGFATVCRRGGKLNLNQYCRKRIQGGNIKVELPHYACIHGTPAQSGSKGDPYCSIPEHPGKTRTQGTVHRIQPEQVFRLPAGFQVRIAEKRQPVGFGQEIRRRVRLKMQVMVPVYHKLPIPSKWTVRPSKSLCFTLSTKESTSFFTST